MRTLSVSVSLLALLLASACVRREREVVVVHDRPPPQRAVVVERERVEAAERRVELAGVAGRIARCGETARAPAGALRGGELRLEATRGHDPERRTRRVVGLECAGGTRLGALDHGHGLAEDG